MFTFFFIFILQKALRSEAATTYASKMQAMCLLPTPSGKESHKKQHCEKPRILAATPDSDAPPSKGPTEASEATEA